VTGTAAYLQRLGIEQALPPTLESLALLHRRHLETVPYENLGIMLGRPPSVDPQACLERVARVGRAGDCFHQNGAFETVLRDLGFEVTRWHGHVFSAEEQRARPTLNHLALTVDGLPTAENREGRWWVDVGLGDAFLDPLPLVAGEHEQQGFCYTITDVRADGWSFRHDRSGSFTGIDVSARPTDPASVLAAHAELSTPPDGRFTRLLAVQRRHAGGADTLRGCLWTRVGSTGRSEVELATYEAWRGALEDGLCLSLDDVDEDQLTALWDRSWAAHQVWTAAGRP
jgi:N-hydroxyarylamine O-acetyltransferase